MSVIDARVARFLDEIPVGVLATTRRDGGIRQSVVYFVRDGDRILVSTESKRGKARDAERVPNASLCVQSPTKPYASVTVEGKARIVREDIGPPTARIIERITGNVAKPASDQELREVDRVILELDVTRVYGASYLPDAT